MQGLRLPRNGHVATIVLVGLGGIVIGAAATLTVRSATLSLAALIVVVLSALTAVAIARTALVTHERDRVAARLHAILETTTNGIILREGPDLAPTLLNRAALALLDIHADELPQYLAGRRHWQPLDADGKPVAIRDTVTGTALATGKPATAMYGIRHRDGSMHWHDVTAVPFRGPGTDGTAVLVSIADATALRESEARFRAVIDSVDEGIIMQDADGVIHLWNPAAERILGLTGEQLLGRTSYDPQWVVIDTHGDALPGDRHPVSIALRDGVPAVGEMGVQRGAAGLVWIRASAVPMTRPGEAHPYGATVAFADITAYREAVAASAASEAKFRGFVEASRDIVAEVDDGFRVTYVSPRVEQVLGWRVEELVGRDFVEFMVGDGGERVSAVRQQAASGDARPVGPTAAKLRARDGSIRWLESSPAVQRDANGRMSGAVLAIRDVSERVALEEQLRQASKREAVGTLAGGIAHEFNNLLAVIKGSAELLQGELTRSSGAWRDAVMITQAVEKGQVLTRRLLSFTEQQVVQIGTWSVDTVITELQTLLERTLRPGQSLHFDLHADAWIRADRAELELALVSLVANARDASSPNGIITIQTDVHTSEEPSVTTPPSVEPSDFVRVRVVDAGKGFSADALQRQFEPFFTTKADAQSVGLGLATVYGIMQRAGGAVRIESVEGLGATISLYLPKAHEPDAVVAPTEPDEAPIHRPSAFTILLVDDDAGVRAVTMRVLTRLGYRVIAAAGGHEAIDILRESPEAIDAIVTDYSMPGMTGVELLVAARAQGFAQPALLMSGFTDDPDTRTSLQDSGTRFIAKPFSRDDLGEALAAVLM